jgi:subfamily B ATP-binding cassette protein MsbA
VTYHLYQKVQNWVLLDKVFVGRSAIYSLIINMTLIAVLLTVIKGFFNYGRTYGYNSLIHKTLMHIRNLIYGKLIHLPVTYYDNNRTGDLMSKTTVDVDNIKGALQSLLTIMLEMIQTLFYVVWLLLLNWQLTLFAGLIIPVMAYLLKRFGKPIRKANIGIVESVSQITIFLQETLQGIRIIKIFNKEKDEKEKFRGLAKENYAANMKETRLSTLLKPLNDVFAVIGFMSVLLFLAYQMLYQSYSLGSVVAYVALLNFAYKPLKNISGLNDALQRTLASCGRIFDLVNLEDELAKRPPNPIPLPSVNGLVRFDRVSFSYSEDKPILKEISLEVMPGKTLAIVGPSGSGKSTLVNLIPLFYQNYKGIISIDGVDLSLVSINDLRRHIAIVPQDTVLFSGTVMDNIRYAKTDATDAEVEKVAQLANAHRFILSLRNGYHTEIGERGVQLSGGEKQRISIARALLKNPKILILDEATSALDTESEQLVQQALQTLMKDRTTFVIAHRLSTIKDADSIIVLDKGMIVEQGTHEELYSKKNGLYRKLCKIQFEMVS